MGIIDPAIQAENHKRIVDFFRAGIHDSAHPLKLGVEVEHFVVHGPDETPVYYQPHDGIIGVCDVLDHLRCVYPEEIRNEDGDLIGLSNETANLSLEPAAQLEISIAPYERISEVQMVYEAFRACVDPFLSSHGCHLATFGYHPSSKAKDLPLIPKPRYRFMDEYFSEIGTHGYRMMRASASTQVSIDYTSEADAIRKLRCAVAITPVLGFISETIALFEGVFPEALLTRLHMWRDVDNTRCGTISSIFSPDFDFDVYADTLLDTAPIFVTRPAADDPGGAALRYFSHTVANDAYGDAEMSVADINHLISMFWPDVRLKDFVEIRCADSMPAEYVYAYTALIKGLFYSEESLRTIEEVVGAVDNVWPLAAISTTEAIRDIRDCGVDALIHGKPLKDWVYLLFACSENALDDEEAAYLDPLRARTQKRLQQQLP